MTASPDAGPVGGPVGTPISDLGISEVDGPLDDAQQLLAGMLHAVDADTTNLRHTTLSGDPVAKVRPRFGRGGRTYTPTAYAEAEDYTHVRLRRWIRTPMTGNVAIACVFYRSTRRRIDVDNLLKHVLDAANGVLWKDDSQVTAVIGTVQLDRRAPRTVIGLAPHRSTLDRQVTTTRRTRGTAS